MPQAIINFRQHALTAMLAYQSLGLTGSLAVMLIGIVARAVSNRRGEWEDWSTVHCLGCNQLTEYATWSKRETEVQS